MNYSLDFFKERWINIQSSSDPWISTGVWCITFNALLLVHTITHAIHFHRLCIKDQLETASQKCSLFENLPVKGIHCSWRIIRRTWIKLMPIESYIRLLSRFKINYENYQIIIKKRRKNYYVKRCEFFFTPTLVTERNIFTNYFVIINLKEKQPTVVLHCTYTRSEIIWYIYL